MPITNLAWRAFRPEEGFYTSEVMTTEPEESRRQPLRTFLPTGYEPNYPYPLLVFLHGQGSSEEQILKLAPRLSRRNFVCIALRGPQSLGKRADGRPSFGWGSDGQFDTVIEDYVFRAVEQTRRTYHIHSERIYLAGFREGAQQAYKLGLMFPEKFGGVIALNGTLPRGRGPLLRLPEVRSLKILIGHGIANPIVPLTLAESDYRLFYAAGMDVQMATYPTTHRLHPDMLRDVNRWIIDLCTQE